MKAFRNFVMLVCMALTLLACRKEYLEPFDFYLSGTINGQFVNMDADESNRNTIDSVKFISRTASGLTDFDPCGPKSFQKETSSKFSNSYFLTNGSRLWEQEWSISFRECVLDSTDVLFQDMVKIGASPVLGIDDKGTGIVIEHWNGRDIHPNYSTRLGPQTNPHFTVLRHKQIEGYEAAFNYITEGNFSATLWNISGHKIELENMAFKMKTIPVLEVEE